MRKKYACQAKEEKYKRKLLLFVCKGKADFDIMAKRRKSMKPPILDFFKGDDVISGSFVSKRPENVKFKKYLEQKGIDTALLVFTKEEELSASFSPRFLKKVFALINVSFSIPIFAYKNKFLIAITPLGGPAAADGVMSELAFLGIKNFFACGSAGQIDEKINPTEFVLVQKAIRDEGTSYHYQKPSTYISTNAELTNFVAEYFKGKGYKYHLATTWTTDAFYRETPLAIEKRKKQGASCVEMECASWCAVAKFRGLKFAQVLYFSDLVKQGAWDWHKTKDDLKTLVIKIMIDCVEIFVKK